MKGSRTGGRVDYAECWESFVSPSPYSPFLRPLFINRGLPGIYSMKDWKVCSLLQLYRGYRVFLLVRKYYGFLNRLFDFLFEVSSCL